jgi:hypothetical protein
MYTLAASAAGVGMLALAQSAEAKIVYTPAGVTFGTASYSLDVNHDGITDFSFVIRWNSFYENFTVSGAVSNNSVVLKYRTGGGAAFAAALSAGSRIGPKGHFIRWGYMQRASNGQWYNAANRYLGLKFQIAGQTHYGWARLSVRGGWYDINAALTGYAYETIPNKPIIAGRTKGPADDPTSDPDFASPDDPGSGASVIGPIEDTPQPALLGMLALGAQGVPLWRRKESAVQGN